MNGLTGLSDSYADIEDLTLEIENMQDLGLGRYWNILPEGQLSRIEIGMLPYSVGISKLNEGHHTIRGYHNYINPREKCKEEQKSIIRAIVESDDIMEYLGNADITHAFEQNDWTIRCMDERNNGGIRVPLPLLNYGEIRSLIKMASESAEESGAQVRLEPHKECGAGAVAHQRALRSPYVSKVDARAIDAYTLEHTKKRAQQFGVPYTGLVELTPWFHPARAAVVSDKYVNPSEIKGFPLSFVIHAGYLTPERTSEALNIAHKVASGKSGSGDITEEEPFAVFVIGDTRLMKTVKNSVGNHNDVAVCEFNAPDD